MRYTEEDLNRIRNERKEQERFIRFLYQQANAWLTFTGETLNSSQLTLDEQSLYPDRFNQDSIRFYIADEHGDETDYFIPISYIFNDTGTPALTIPDSLSQEDIITLQKASSEPTIHRPAGKHPNYDPKFGWDDETPDSWRHLPEDPED